MGQCSELQCCTTAPSINLSAFPTISSPTMLTKVYLIPTCKGLVMSNSISVFDVLVADVPGSDTETCVDCNSVYDVGKNG
ncbi:hypothetical protein ACLOJK_017923 [Asimina triloba]